MSDDFNKIIKFEKHKDSSVKKDEYGVFYVRAEKDENGNFFNKNHLIDFCNQSVYIIRVMRIENDKPCVYSYKVPGDEIVSFISRYSDDNESEKIIEINKCQPHNLA